MSTATQTEFVSEGFETEATAAELKFMAPAIDEATRHFCDRIDGDDKVEEASMPPQGALELAPTPEHR